MNRYVYHISVGIDFGKLSSTVGDLAKELNETMAGFGFSEKLSFRSDIPLNLTVSRPLTDPEKAKVAEIINESYKNLDGRVLIFLGPFENITP